MPQVKDRKVSITQRAQAMALLEYGVSISEVATISKLSAQTLYNMRKRLRERGYNPEVNTAFEDRFFKDAPRSGRPVDPNSRRSLKKAAKGGQKLDPPTADSPGIAAAAAVPLPLTGQDTPPISPSNDINIDIDPTLITSAPHSAAPVPDVNYRPAPYRKDLNSKVRQNSKHNIPPTAIFVGNGWMVPIESQQQAFPTKVPIPRLQPMSPAVIHAGVTDSALTNHGALQAKKLGTYLSTRYKFTHLFSSDLQRAVKTAVAIQQAQQEENNTILPLYQLKILQEQDFGTFEKMTFAARAKAAQDNADNLRQPETKEAMAVRANEFLDDHLLPLIASETMDEAVEMAVVSHGLILSTFWRCLLKRFAPGTIDVARGVEIPNRDMLSLEHLGAWSNTGFLDLDVTLLSSNSNDTIGNLGDIIESDRTSEPFPPILDNYKMKILAVNSREHLQGLKRTGGGVGSSKHDDKQQPLESFFKKRRVT